ncbi:MAG: NAD(P)-dependent alcohol dehydrogenase [Verrucomicrobiota bacterium]
MKAIRYYQYGGPEVLRMEEIPIPEPGPGEVLIRVNYTALNPLDWRMVRAEPIMVRPYSGLIKPKKFGLGADFSGIVERCHLNAKQFEQGEAVLGTVFPNDLGALAEYVLVPETSIVSKPDSLSFEEASTLGVAALTALQGIRKYQKLGPQSRVLINGGSGGVGTFSIQIAKASQAHVTAISSSRNHPLIQSIGADQTICYHETKIQDLACEPFDLIYDTVGSYTPDQLSGLLSETGQLVFASAKNSWGFIRNLLVGKMNPRIHMIVDLDKSQKELGDLLDLCENGMLHPVIDKIYNIEDIANAFAYIESMRARGKVLVKMAA